ncbi:MAG: di-trans,poly-cis-decaprenylcistransferase [Verrucomicrobia bacterium]|nr:di-trans,poly-cis-decaprenylcistransferase [Verrucomicrobiota bacterium]
MHSTAPEEVGLKRVPKHVAIIMDGNRRWAQKHGVSTTIGHWKGAEALMDIVDAASDLGIEVLTVYAFSTENWNRSEEEVEGIMQLFKMYLSGQCERMVREGVRLDAIGDLQKLPSDVLSILEETKAATAHGSRINLVLAINYGARDDIRRAVSSVVTDCLEGKLDKEAISEKILSEYLDTAEWQDPELLIRTSGELRLSNFLLWQISYSEIHITDVLWPDFNENHLVQALLDYQRRERRAGC